MARAILSVFEEYQKSRVAFVQTVAELAMKPQNVDVLQNAGAVSLLRSLLFDNVASIQHSAALALGRLASYNEDLAELVVSNEVLPQVVYSLTHQNRFYKKAGAFVLRSVAKHSPQLAQAVVDCGALDALVSCLEEFDPAVKESVAWALGYIARHSKELAQTVVDAGAVSLLKLCYQEPELSLRRISASVLSDIAKHSIELAQAVVDSGVVALFVKDLSHTDAALKRQVCSCLSQVAKHSVDLAEFVVEAEVFPKLLHCMKNPDMAVRNNASACVREIARQSPDLAKTVVNAGGISALVDYTLNTRGDSRLAGIMAIGYISAFSEQLALAVIAARGVSALKESLTNEDEDHIKAAAAWCLGQMGKHSPDHARALAEADILRRLLAVYVDPQSSEDLKFKAKRALKSVIQKCVYIAALEPLLQASPSPILKHVIQQFSKVLPHDLQGRRSLVQTGGLQKIQEIRNTTDEGSELREYIDSINNLYPPEIVNYYSPDYPASLLNRLDEYSGSA